MNRLRKGRSRANSSQYVFEFGLSTLQLNVLDPVAGEPPDDPPVARRPQLERRLDAVVDLFPVMEVAVDVREATVAGIRL